MLYVHPSGFQITVHNVSGHQLHYYKQTNKAAGIELVQPSDMHPTYKNTAKRSDLHVYIFEI